MKKRFAQSLTPNVLLWACLSMSACGPSLEERIALQAASVGDLDLRLDKTYGQYSRPGPANPSEACEELLVGQAWDLNQKFELTCYQFAHSRPFLHFVVKGVEMESIEVSVPFKGSVQGIHLGLSAEDAEQLARAAGYDVSSGSGFKWGPKVTYFRGLPGSGFPEYDVSWSLDATTGRIKTLTATNHIASF